MTQNNLRTITSIANFNRVVGKDPEEHQMLKETCNTPEGRANVLAQNAAFYQTIMGLIYTKNKWDYPPVGWMYDSQKVFQNTKLQYLLEAYRTFELGGLSYNSRSDTYTNTEQVKYNSSDLKQEASPNTVTGGGWFTSNNKQKVSTPDIELTTPGDTPHPDTRTRTPNPIIPTYQIKPQYASEIRAQALALNNINGKNPGDLEKLNDFCTSIERKVIYLTTANGSFKSALDTACGTKNAADYPGDFSSITDPQTREFQTQKLRCIFQAILDIGQLGEVNSATVAKSGFNTLGTWTMNAARGTGRTIMNPLTTAKSTATSVKNVGKYGGKRRNTKRKKSIRRTYKRRPHRPKRRSIRRL